MRLPHSNKPQYALTVLAALAAMGVVYGLSVATAQQSAGPPGPGWRDVTPKSSLQNWRDGTDRQGRARQTQRRYQKPR